MTTKELDRRLEKDEKIVFWVWIIYTIAIILILEFGI